MVLPFLCTHTINISFIKWIKSSPESPISEQKNLVHIIANFTTLQNSTPSKRILSNPQINVTACLSPLLCRGTERTLCQSLPVTAPRSNPTCASVSGTYSTGRKQMVSPVQVIGRPFNKERLAQGSHEGWCSSPG